MPTLPPPRPTPSSFASPRRSPPTHAGPDLRRVAARSIAPYLRPGNLVILESTSPVGTTPAWRTPGRAVPRPELSRTGPERPDVRLAYCPERVLPGRILEELVHNDRVIGGLTPRAAGGPPHCTGGS